MYTEVQVQTLKGNLGKELYYSIALLQLKWSTKTGHRVRVFPVSIFRFVWG